MGNPLKGEVEFPCNGMSYTLRYNINAMCTLEAALGMSVMEVMAVLGDTSKLSISMFRTMFWVGLRDKHPEMTEDQAGIVMDAVGLQEAGTYVAKAFELAFPTVKASNVPLAAGHNASTGSRRLASGAKPGLSRVNTGA